MSSNYYAMLFRMKYINRWALMRNLHPETLSEHSLETAFIAHSLAVIHNRRFGGCIDPNACATAALFHDTAEVITGDLPTPVKYYNSDIKKAYKAIEQTAEKQLLALLPQDLQADFLSLYTPSPAIARFVKAADKLSALIKCREELRLGNAEFAKAEQATVLAIRQLELPECDVFMEEFLPAFSKALDDNVDGGNHF